MEPAKGQLRSVLVVCTTHDDIAEVPAATRGGRQQAGELGDSVTVDHDEPLHYLLAQKTGPQQFHARQVIVFHDNTPEARCP